MEGVCKPALVVKCPLAKHRVELEHPFPVPSYRGVAGTKLSPSIGLWVNPFRTSGGRDTQQLVECRHDIHGMDILVADFSFRLYSLWPCNDTHIGRRRLHTLQTASSRGTACQRPMPSRCSSGYRLSGLPSSSRRRRFSLISSGILLKNFISLKIHSDRLRRLRRSLRQR